ncbi:hypothetical protein F441_12767 [Phytophthora nicotianae CJ01A1]|uniref:Uncharacterized protein n=4 Tax=Phytophthora nicotianae TaxID=4792 RepID=W2YXV3_PHYNI|nr:hypothetical protein L915_12523 [Phytophthora nicotianae]ETL35425.1 hypothetical protein L916_12434 [Phytophthora nicotianae]ETP11757.1 hypothetical protein F441_12767 [Phytophthora nicotianae CJ01A1]ETP39848.1 hypothetical protein F442_12719 [Phytophthora nicotianae P10297]
MNNFIKILALLLATAVSVVSAKMRVWVYAGAYLGADRWSMKFSTTQKCYTFSSCLDDDSVGADWSGIDESAIVFYEKEQCQGEKLISRDFPKGQLMFSSFDKGAKSFMVWSDGMYATRGIELECLERARLNATNATNSSGEVDDATLPSNV